MYWRIVLIGVTVALLTGSHWKAYTAGQKNIRTEYQLKVGEQEKEYRAKERELTLAKNEAEVKYEELKKSNARSFAAVRTERDGLRIALANREREARANPASVAGVDAGSTERELLSEGADALVTLAAEADQLRIQVTGLQAYVSNVCLRP
jgi:hypothetical protein